MHVRVPLPRLQLADLHRPRSSRCVSSNDDPQAPFRWRAVNEQGV
jgi:hypothetical protein